jgi:hypothetical protein
MELVKLIQVLFRFKYFNIKHNRLYMNLVKCIDWYTFSKNWYNKSVVGFTYSRQFVK